jgi:hypothetical protein
MDDDARQTSSDRRSSERASESDTTNTEGEAKDGDEDEQEFLPEPHEYAKK